MSSMKDVAKHAEVSSATVSRYINDSGYVSDKNKKKIQKSIDELQYVPNELARSFYRNSSKMIGIIVPNINNPFFTEMASYVGQCLFAKGYKSIFCNVEDNSSIEQEYIDMLRQYKVDGFIIISSTNGQSYKNIDIPIVAFDRSLGGNTVTVTCDNYKGGEEAGKYLLSSGCKNILEIKGPSNILNMVERSRGFRHVLNEENLKYKELEVSLDIDEAILLIKSILTTEKIDGIFVPIDILATAVVKLSNQLNIKIPQQLKIIGFDGIKLGDMIQPTFSTIKQPINEMGNLAVELMMDMINKKEIKEKKYTLPIELIKR